MNLPKALRLRVSADVAPLATVMNSVIEEIRALSTFLAANGADTTRISFARICRDIPVFVALGAVESVNANIVVNGVITRRYRFVVSERPLSPGGPPTGILPLPLSVVDGTALGIAIIPSPRITAVEFAARLAIRDWVPSQQLPVAPLLTPREYGRFTECGFAVRRFLDAPDEPDGTQPPSMTGELN